MTLGNGTSAWKYTEVGELVFIVGKIEWGSTTSLSGGFDVAGLPFNINSDIGVETPIGGLMLRDIGTQFYRGDVCQFLGNANKIDPAVTRTNATFATIDGINATQPFTWTTNDQMNFWFSYRKA